jgi:hypothetical protein
MKTAAGAFLAGAASRLLPAAIPFRFFGAAVAYHLLAWLALLAGADGLPAFAAGAGWPLAALHLVTLGVLVMTAMGASLQLLPVATRQPVRSTRWPAAIWWLYTPGVAAVALGMGRGVPWLLGLGALAVVLAVLAFAALLAINLRGARGMPGVVAHGWAALACLGVVLGTALALALAWLGLPLIGRATALALHIAFAAYGFMGLLALGLSYILVPMFALAEAPDERRALASCALAVAALVLAGLAAGGLAPQPLRVLALVAGASAVVLHLRLMRHALRTGMRRHLGRSFTLVRVAWALLLVSLALALAVALDAPLDGLSTLFGLALIGGWLLTFLLGILQRILPFLASMHAGRGARRAPTPSSLSADRPLAIHFYCHLGALAGLALAALAGSPLIAALAAGIGVVGAAAFGAFFVIVLRRMRGAAGRPAA